MDIHLDFIGLRKADGSAWISLWPGDHPPDQNETVIPRVDVGLLSCKLFQELVDGLAGPVSLSSGSS